MNELSVFFKGLLQRVEAKVESDVTALKAKFEEEKQQMITDFTALENELKSKIEGICAFPDETTTTDQTGSDQANPAS